MKRKHKGQLVCQHLERISRKLLEEYPEVIRQFVKGRHGIYSLYRGNHLYYVGLASNLRSRLHHHLRDRHGQTWDHFSIYLTLTDSHLPELESLVLRIASPKGNIQAGKFQKSQDLRRSVRRMVREAQTREWKELLGEQTIIQKIQPKDKDNGVLAQYLYKRIHLRFRYKGKLYVAHVRKDGWITFAAESAEAKRLQGKEYKSPSAAASAVTGHEMDGWRNWKYERSPNEWVLIDELRKR
jgi:hypothetical protein